MIRNIVFDMGGVLINWSPERITARLELSAEERQTLVRELFQTVEWVSLDRGTLTEPEAIRIVCARLPQGLHAAVERCVYWWKDPLWPMEGMAELIRQLKDLGYGIYLLSNATSALHGYFPRIPGSACFDGGLVSADWKLLKPQHEIYEKFCALNGLSPETCFFIDDAPVNIEGAARAGIGGTVFRGDMARLRRELRAAGIPVKTEDA